MQNHEEPDAEPGAACRTPFCKKIGGTADFEVNFLAPEEETDGLFLSYTVVQGTPSVCDALAKSRNEFSQAPQSHKVVLQRLLFKQELTQDFTVIVFLRGESIKDEKFKYAPPAVQGELASMNCVGNRLKVELIFFQASGCFATHLENAQQ